MGGGSPDAASSHFHARRLQLLPRRLGERPSDLSSTTPELHAVPWPFCTARSAAARAAADARSIMGIGRRAFLRGRLRGQSQEPGATTPAPTEALSRAEVRRRATLNLGRFVARVETDNCLGSIGQVCTVCVERCPEPGVLSLVGLLPQVDGEKCTGCGECEQRCPSPLLAIRVTREGT